MAGLVPAIHVFVAAIMLRRGCPAPVYARLRRAFSVLGRRSFSEGGKARACRTLRTWCTLSPYLSGWGDNVFVAAHSGAANICPVDSRVESVRGDDASSG